MEVLSPFLADRNNDRYNYTFTLLGLLTATHATKMVLTKISSRFSELPQHRQEKVQTLIPLTAIHICAASLIAEVEFGLQGRQKTMHELDYQFDVFYFLCLGYVFELLYLRSFLADFIHHACVIGATYWFFLKRQTEDPQYLLNIAQIPTIMGICSFGLLNVGLNGLRLVYFGLFTFKARTLRALVTILSRVAWTGFLTQWSLILRHLTTTPLITSLGWVERTVAVCVFLLWAQDELKATMKLSRMAMNSCDSDYSGEKAKMS